MEKDPLMKPKSDFYAGEKEPDQKNLELVKTKNTWGTGLFNCFSCSGEYVSEDAEICVVGTFAPCLLYASNYQTVFQEQGNFCANVGAYLAALSIDNLVCPFPVVAPSLSLPVRIQLRKALNIEGYGNYWSCGCTIENEDTKEKLDHMADFLTRIICHPCALCQETREIRRQKNILAIIPVSPLTPPFVQGMVNSKLENTKEAMKQGEKA